MLNIISKSVVSKYVSGPQKVVKNLIKGLDNIGYPYVVNARLDATNRLWIHDDIKALREINKLPNYVKVVVGPNLFILPRNIPNNIDLSRVIYLQPSKWAKDFWIWLGFDKTKLEIWPTGIDLNEFSPAVDKKNDIVTIYFKKRYEDELRFVENILNSIGLNYEIIFYGRYNEEQFKYILNRSRYLIWIGMHESQGIALQEVLSCNVPILVWDVHNFGYFTTPNLKNTFNAEELSYPCATSAEYFDNRCGIKICNKNKLLDGIKFMEKNYESFNPRQYIIENLSLEKQARELINFYDKYFNLSFEEGFNEGIMRRGKWSNGKIYYITFYRLKEIFRRVKFLRKIKDLIKKLSRC